MTSCICGGNVSVLHLYEMKRLQRGGRVRPCDNKWAWIYKLYSSWM